MNCILISILIFISCPFISYGLVKFHILEQGGVFVRHENTKRISYNDEATWFWFWLIGSCFWVFSLCVIALIVIIFNAFMLISPDKK